MKTVPVFDTYLKHLNPRIIMGRFCLTVFGIYHWKGREKGIPIYICIFTRLVSDRVKYHMKEIKIRSIIIMKITTIYLTVQLGASSLLQITN